jgi:hypothetical protein
MSAVIGFFAGSEPWAGDFLRTARGVGLQTEIVGAFSDTPEMRRRAGNGLEGSFYFDIYDPASKEPENQAFVRKFKTRYGRDPDSWAAQGYDVSQRQSGTCPEESSGSRNPKGIASSHHPARSQPERDSTPLKFVAVRITIWHRGSKSLA